MKIAPKLKKGNKKIKKEWKILKMCLKKSNGAEKSKKVEYFTKMAHKLKKEENFYKYASKVQKRREN